MFGWVEDDGLCAKTFVLVVRHDIAPLDASLNKFQDDELYRRGYFGCLVSNAI